MHNCPEQIEHAPSVHPQATNRGKRIIGDGGSSLPLNDNQKLPPLWNRGECRGEEGAGLANHSEALATYLAERLHDWRSLAFYRKVARSLPEEVVRDALSRALDVPRHAIRRSRAAYFTTLIVKSLPKNRRFHGPNQPASPL